MSHRRTKILTSALDDQQMVKVYVNLSQGADDRPIGDTADKDAGFDLVFSYVNSFLHCKYLTLV